MKTFLLLLMLPVILTGCSTLSPLERDSITAMAEKTVETLCAEHHELGEALEAAPGRMVLDVRLVKIPVLGGGRGKGVVTDHRTGEQIFIKGSRVELGGGWGARSYKLLLVFEDESVLEKVCGGTWSFALGAEASAGKASVEGTSGDMKADSGYRVYTLTGGGASATYTLRAVRLKPCRN